MDMPRQDTDQRPDVKEVTDVVVRFAGDSGDGMQLTGTNFTAPSVEFANLSTEIARERCCCQSAAHGPNHHTGSSSRVSA